MTPAPTVLPPSQAVKPEVQVRAGMTGLPDHLVVQIHSFVLQGPPQGLPNTLSSARPQPAMLMAIAAESTRLDNGQLVNGTS